MLIHFGQESEWAQFYLFIANSLGVLLNEFQAFLRYNLLFYFYYSVHFETMLSYALSI